MLRHLLDVLQTLSQVENFTSRHFENEEQLVNDEIYNRRIREVLIYSHKLHVRIIDFTDCINSCYSYALMMEVWTILMSFCIIALMIVNVSDLFRIIAMSSNIMSFFSLFASICYESDELRKQSELIIFSCCGAAWWTFDKDNLLFIQLMSLRSIRSLALKIGSFQTVSVRTLKMIFKVSVSYFLFLYQFKRSL
ncbi:Hypothetical predicted protein [Cloeon dipterum]|uniref:Odorant receptor n=1 Tax=Cloeon dipterum TaxID=197152 RepID=A0A8S1CG01_9INSE|nr:Hypothetical predicted protein [Cloeon dipterum]